MRTGRGGVQRAKNDLAEPQPRAKSSCGVLRILNRVPFATRAVFGRVLDASRRKRAFAQPFSALKSQHTKRFTVKVLIVKSRTDDRLYAPQFPSNLQAPTADQCLRLGPDSSFQSTCLHVAL